MQASEQKIISVRDVKQKIKASCTCGQKRKKADGAPDRVGVCHCRDCQRHHGAPFYAAAIFSKNAVSVTGQTREHRGRHICTTCGASVFAISGDEIELHLGVLDAEFYLKPSYECWTIRRVSWLVPIEGALQFERDRT